MEEGVANRKGNCMDLTFRPITEKDVRQIFTWEYEAPYDIYNLPSENIEEELGYFLDPQNNFFSLFSNQDLTAFCSYGSDARVPGGDYTEEALDIGMGVKPDLTGQGNGSDFARAVLLYALNSFQPEKLRVTIAGFNERARRVWEKLGFEQTQTFNNPRGKPFVILCAGKETILQVLK
jgi:RimJ/RimL family protein N-acetyltransferase